MRKQIFKQEIAILSIIILCLGVLKDIPKVRYYGVVCEEEDNGVWPHLTENIEEYDDTQSSRETTMPDVSYDKIYTKKSKTLVATPHKVNANVGFPNEQENNKKRKNKSKFHWRRENDFKILQTPEIVNSNTESNNYNSADNEPITTNKQKMQTIGNKQYSKNKALKREDLKQLSLDLSYKQVNDDLNDVCYIAHDSLLHRHDPNIYLTTKKQNITFHSFITGPNLSSVFVDTQHAVELPNSFKWVYKRNSKPYKNYNFIKTRNKSSEIDYPTINKSSYNPDSSNDQDFAMYSDLENNEMLHSEDDKNHPEIEHKLPKSFNEHSKLFTDYKIASNNSKLVKQKQKSNNYNNVDDEERNEIHKDSKEPYDENYIDENLSLQETNTKKKLTQVVHSPESHVDKSVTGTNEDKYNNVKKITEQTSKENYVQKVSFVQHETPTKANTPKYTTSLKKSQEGGKPKYRDHVGVKSPNKQCHPPAGPQKFKWCSDEFANVRDQEYEDALTGKVALRIVEAILAKVHKSSKMSHDFGFCSSEKKIGRMVNENCDASNSILKSQDLQEIMASMKKLSSKACNQLPPKLKEFLEWLIKVKPVQSAQRKGAQKRHSISSKGDTAFHFNQYSTPNSYNQEIQYANEQSNYYNSTFEDFDKCDFNEISKDQNDYDVDRMKHDAEIIGETNNIELNNLISDNENNNQLDNMKSKRYVFDENLNYPYSRDPEGINAEKGELFESEKQLEQLQNFKPSPKNDINSEDENDLKLYSGSMASNNIPYNNLQYEEDNDYTFNEINNNFDDLSQVRSKRNKKKLKFLTDKQEELNFEELINHDNINEQLRRTIIIDREKVNKLPDTFESDQQLGFDTPIVFRITDEEDTIM